MLDCETCTGGRAAKSAKTPGIQPGTKVYAQIKGVALLK
jgi:hypothetical protein